LADIENFMDSTEKRLVEQNMAKMKRNCEEQSSVELRRMEMEMNVVLEEKKKWEEEKKTLKEEKKNLEYSLFDLLKANNCNKGKMKKI
jgi:hypothetical protein